MALSNLKRARRIFLWTTLVVVLALPVLVFELLPFCAPLISLPAITIDLAKDLPNEVSALISNKTITADFSLAQSRRGGLLLTARGKLLDWPYTLKVDADYSLLALTADATADFTFDGSDLNLSARARATPRTWRGELDLPTTTLTEKTPILADLLSRLDLGNISNLTFSAAVSLKAAAEKTREIPVPVWFAKARLRNGSATALLGEMPISTVGVHTSFGAEGIADRVSFETVTPRIRETTLGALTISNFASTIRPSERGFIVNEASAEFCGGEIRVYSLYLDPQRLSGGFTLFLDNINAGEILCHLKGFNGEATGRLHGKLPLTLKNGNELRLKDAYLYSTPGEMGTIKVSNPEPILNNLALSGVDQATCDNLGKALANLLYSVLKLDLRRDENGELALGLKVEGSSTHGRTTVPVSFTVTFHGDLEQLINTGLKLRKQ